MIAFADALELRESALLNQIRAELRGLGAALFLVARGRIFSFHPDDELDLYGTSSAVDTKALSDLRAACGFSQNTNAGELALIVLGGDGTLLSMANCIGEAGSNIPILGVSTILCTVIALAQPAERSLP